MTNSNQKLKKGQTVMWQESLYKVDSISYISHPEQLISGERAKEGVYVFLKPYKYTEGEEPSGWINQRQIKVLTRKQIKILEKSIRERG